MSSLDLDSERRLITGELPVASVHALRSHRISLRKNMTVRCSTGSWDKTVRVWKLPADGVHTEATLVLKEHTSSILAMQVAQDEYSIIWGPPHCSCQQEEGGGC